MALTSRQLGSRLPVSATPPRPDRPIPPTTGCDPGGRPESRLARARNRYAEGSRKAAHASMSARRRSSRPLRK